MPCLIDAHVHVDLIGHDDYERFYDFMGGMERINDVWITMFVYRSTGC